MTHEYDKNLNRIYADENGDITEYTYDGMSRLTEVTKNSTKTTSYEFDGYNNIIKEYEFFGGITNKKIYQYDANNRLILTDDNKEIEQYSYDKEGNMTEKTIGIGAQLKKQYYSYDGYNRLSEFVSDTDIAQYSYDITGMRKTKTVNGETTRFVYQGGNIIGEITAEKAYKYYRGTEILGSISGNENQYYRTNAHGDITAILNMKGEVIQDYSYDAYGNKESISINPEGTNTILYRWKQEINTTYNPFGYCGEYTDDETDLIYLRNRYYDNTTGRFITEDPITDGLNWYVYCGNNPVMFCDPLGTIKDSDESEFGKDSLVYDSLTTLGEMWELRPDNRKEIEELANTVRTIARQKTFSIKLAVAQKNAPTSANSTDIILIAGKMDKALLTKGYMDIAQQYADELYGQDRDGNQHNALKHTMWNALMSKNIGKTYAKLMGDSHEFGAKENLKQDVNQQELMNMDLWNNAIGRNLGTTFKKSHFYGNYEYELAWEIVKLINSKEIWVVNWTE